MAQVLAGRPSHLRHTEWMFCVRGTCIRAMCLAGLAEQGRFAEVAATGPVDLPTLAALPALAAGSFRSGRQPGLAEALLVNSGELQLRLVPAGDPIPEELDCFGRPCILTA